MAWKDDITAALEELGGTATYAQLYPAVARRRTGLPESWQEVIRRTIQQRSSDSAAYTGVEDLYFSVEGIGHGVWGLRRWTRPIRPAIDIAEGTDIPARAEQRVYRILRDTKLARQIKLLHRDQCQICGLALQKADGGTYSEAHHIIPLGAPHDGPDVAGNILVVCPNHHALCDFGAIRLDIATLTRVDGHSISSNSVDYHNRVVAGSR